MQLGSSEQVPPRPHAKQRLVEGYASACLTGLPLLYHWRSFVLSGVVRGRALYCSTGVHLL